MITTQTVEIPVESILGFDRPSDPISDSSFHVEARPNAETLAGMREVDDMLAGRTPEKWYGSIAEMIEDGDSDN